MKCNVLIDWLTFTVKNCKDPNFVIAWYLGMDADLFKDELFGLMGYDKVKSFNDIMVCYAPRENEHFRGMGICVSMSGNGCRTFENMSKLKLDGITDVQGTANIAFPALFQLLHVGEEINISRVDLACDDHEGYLHMEDIIDKVNANEINSRIQKRSVITSFNGKVATGSSVYLGSESSAFRVRIYDKAKQQGDMESHWVRVELVLRGDHANAFVDNFVNASAVGQLAAAIMNDKFKFIDMDDCNISRCSTAGWWFDFVGDIESVQLVAKEMMMHNIDQVADWVTHQLAPTLGLLFKAQGYFKIKEIIDIGVDRMSNKHRAILQDYEGVRKGGGCNT